MDYSVKNVSTNYEIVSELKPKYLNIFVKGRNNTKEINVNIPIQFVRLVSGLPFISNKIQVSSLLEMIKNGKSGDTLVEVNEKEGDYVHIKLL